jgi:hypothetical protein
MHKTAVMLMQQPWTIARNKMFTIIGFVVEKRIEVKFTTLTVKVTNLTNKEEIVENIEVYFLGRAKEFVDSTVLEGFLVDIIGQVNVSKLSTADLQILRLEGKHIYSYKNVAKFYEEPEPLYVNPQNINRNDLAF